MRKRAKSQKVIFTHSLVNIMGAIGDRALAPMFLHPLQYGGRNLGKAYCLNNGTECSSTLEKVIIRNAFFAT